VSLWRSMYAAPSSMRVLRWGDAHELLLRALAGGTRDEIWKFDQCGRLVSASCFAWEWFWGELYLSGWDGKRTQWGGFR
jgi:hypothetical protein